MRTFLREPLVHFLALGAIVFVLFAFNAAPDLPPDGKIVVRAAKIEQLVAGFSRTWHRPPSEQERDALVEDYIREEVLYREALAMGLDKDDTIVRRRLRQKLEFLTEDASIAMQPTDQHLQKWLDDHPAHFRTVPAIGFSQVYFNPGRPGDSALVAASRALAQIQAAKRDGDASGGVGDTTMLPAELPLATMEEVASIFGDKFAQQVAQLPIQQWAGPVESGYGWHLVYVSKRSAGRPRPLSEVREAVAREWREAEHRRIVEATYRQFRAKYAVLVEAPEPPGRAAPAGSNGTPETTKR